MLIKGDIIEVLIQRVLIQLMHIDIRNHAGLRTSAIGSVTKGGRELLVCSTVLIADFLLVFLPGMNLSRNNLLCLLTRKRYRFVMLRILRINYLILIKRQLVSVETEIIGTVPSHTCAERDFILIGDMMDDGYLWRIVPALSKRRETDQVIRQHSILMNVILARRNIDGEMIVHVIFFMVIPIQHPQGRIRPSGYFAVGIACIRIQPAIFQRKFPFNLRSVEGKRHVRLVAMNAIGILPAVVVESGRKSESFAEVIEFVLRFFDADLGIRLRHLCLLEVFCGLAVPVLGLVEVFLAFFHRDFGIDFVFDEILYAFARLGLGVLGRLAGILQRIELIVERIEIGVRFIESGIRGGYLIFISCPLCLEPLPLHGLILGHRALRLANHRDDILEAVLLIVDALPRGLDAGSEIAVCGNALTSAGIDARRRDVGGGRIGLRLCLLHDGLLLPDLRLKIRHGLLRGDGFLRALGREFLRLCELHLNSFEGILRILELFLCRLQTGRGIRAVAFSLAEVGFCLLQIRFRIAGILLGGAVILQNAALVLEFIESGRDVGDRIH